MGVNSGNIEFVDLAEETGSEERFQAVIASQSRYRVRVTKDYLQFCAAHCISQENGSCERLHGHNYRVAVTLFGMVSPVAHYVFDFITLKAIVRRLVDTWDHRVLLATDNPLLPVTIVGDEVKMTTPTGASYSFPRRDVILLPIPNTTAEMLAALLSAQIRQEIGIQPSLTAIEVEVEETPGQSAVYTETILVAI